MIWRIARGMVTSTSPEHRWRRIAIPVAGAVFALTLLATMSLVRMDHREETRLWNRTGLVAQEPAATDLLMKLGFDRYRDQQFTIIWVEPATSRQPVLPPGLDSLPEPGTFAVSPALATRIAEEPELARRYRSWHVLQQDGVRSNEELFAYARPASGRTIADDPSTMRITAFAVPGAIVSWDFSPALGDVYLRVGALLCLILPGLLVQGAGLATGSTLRDHRLLLLGAIGVPRRALIALSVAESLLLALPGVVLAMTVWVTMSGRLTTVPLLGRSVFAGDLAVGIKDLALLLPASLLAVSGMAVALSWRGLRTGKGRPRPVMTSGTLSWLRVVPSLVAMAMFGVSMTMLGTTLGETLFLLSLALSIATVPLVYAGLIRAIGSELSKIRVVPAMLAGRQLSWDPVRLTRPYAALGTIIMITTVWLGFAALLSSYENPDFDEGSISTVSVSWSDPRPDDLNRLQEALGPVLVVPMSYDDGGFVLGTSCSGIARLFDSTACLPDQPYALPDSLQQELGGVMTVPGPYRLASPDTSSGGAEALVLAREPLQALDERVATAAWQVLPAPDVFSYESLIKRIEDRNVWLISGVIAALAVLGVASVVAVVDRLIANRLQRAVLLRIGLTKGRLRTVEAWLFVVPYLVVASMSLVAGLLMAWLVLDVKNLSIPWGQVGVLVTVAAGAAMIGVVAVVMFGGSTVADRPAIRR